MIKFLAPLFIGCVTIFSSCSPKIFQPLYSPTPTVEINPFINFITPREVPASSIDILEFSLFNEKFPDPSINYVNNQHEIPKHNRLSPHVVISIPDIDLSSTIKDSKDYVPESDPFTGRYQTDGDYNLAEEAVEFALIRKGLTVIDRAKFEAVLRDLRSSNKSSQAKLNEILENIIAFNNHERAMEELEKKHIEGVITDEEKMELETIYIGSKNSTQNGISRNNDKPLDNADLIRIAKNLASNYLLQINNISIEDIGNRSLSIQDIPEVRQFMQIHPELEFGNLPNAIPTTINSDWLKAGFSSKLINTNTGSIVWLGNYEIESINAEAIKVLFHVQKIVNNDDLINDAINTYNANLNSLHSRVKQSGEMLQKKYDQASTEREFDSEDELIKYGYDLKKDIKDLEKSHNVNLNELNNLNNQPPSEAFKTWSYTFVVSEPIMKPSLIDDADATAEGKQHLLKHRKELIRVVTHDIINTIDLKIDSK